MLLRRIVPVTMTMLLLLGACGGGDGDTADRDQEAADQAIAALEERLRAAGLEEAADEEGEDELEFVSDECQELDAAFVSTEEGLPGETASAELEFEGESDLGGQSFHGMVGLVEEPDDLNELFTVLGDERLPRCVEEALVASISEEAGAQAGAVELTSVNTEALQSDIGDRSEGLHIDAELSFVGQTVPLSLEVEYAQVGRGAAGVIVAIFGDAQPAVERTEALQLMLDVIEGQAT